MLPDDVFTDDESREFAAEQRAIAAEQRKREIANQITGIFSTWPAPQQIASEHAAMLARPEDVA